uniref:DNA helicase Pif1-like 2B domain-containing protein n=1 Tax=Octopus bimaculoides TaxID=37653 RepID=A0A0L8G2F6_OCTBM
MNKVFPNPRNQFTYQNWLKSRAILVPKNVGVDDLNSFQIGAPVMLLRNLDPPKLCNDTRFIIKMIPSILETTISTGKASGEPVFIPRITLIALDIPFQYKRLQFPLKLSFAMILNKAQGQSLNVVGLSLEEPVFSYGQLYVGCSRVGNPNHLFIYATQGKNKTVVYEEALEI